LDHDASSAIASGSVAAWDRDIGCRVVYADIFYEIIRIQARIRGCRSAYRDCPSDIRLQAIVAIRAVLAWETFSDAIDGRVRRDRIAIRGIRLSILAAHRSVANRRIRSGAIIIGINAGGIV
jgi:hypothetical protein